LQYYRLQKISEGAINLGEAEAGPLKGPTEIGTGRTEETEILLSELVEQLNERFGTDFGPADQLFFDQIEQSAIEDEELRAAARVNTMENFAYVFERALERLIMERMEGNEAIFTKMMTDDEFRALAATELLRRVYEKLSGDENN
jgi:type I restriction enzyme R subunit